MVCTLKLALCLVSDSFAYNDLVEKQQLRAFSCTRRIFFGMCTKLSSAKYKIFCGQQIRQISMEFPEHAKDNSVHRIRTKLSLAKYKNVCASNEVDGHSWNSTELSELKP